MAGIYDYDYEQDYFVNGDSKFDTMMDDLTGIYKAYVHGDEDCRKTLDNYLEHERLGIPVSESFSTDNTGIRGYLESMGNVLGVENLDQRIVAFNDVDHEDTTFDKEQQDALRQELYAGYQQLPDIDKARGQAFVQRNREEVDLTVELHQEDTLQKAMDWERIGVYPYDFTAEEPRIPDSVLSGKYLDDTELGQVPIENGFQSTTPSQATTGDKTTVVVGVMKENAEGQKSGGVAFIRNDADGMSFVAVGGSKKLPGAEAVLGEDAYVPASGKHSDVPISGKHSDASDDVRRHLSGEYDDVATGRMRNQAGVGSVGVDPIEHDGTSGIRGVGVPVNENGNVSPDVSARVKQSMDATMREVEAARGSRVLQDPSLVNSSEVSKDAAETQTKNHDPAKEVGDDSFVKEALDAAMAKKEREDRMKDVMDKFGDLFKKSKTDEQEFSH